MVYLELCLKTMHSPNIISYISQELPYLLLYNASNRIYRTQVWFYLLFGFTDSSLQNLAQCISYILFQVQN